MTNPMEGTPETEGEQNWIQPRRPSQAVTESVIDEHSSFHGTYRTAQDLRIEGHYDGEIECEGTVTIAEQAVVNAQVRAENITVAGQFEGEIECGSRFEVLPTGRVSGRVSAGVIAVQEGARFDGQLSRADARAQGPMHAGTQGELTEEDAIRRTSGPISVSRRREAS